MKCCTGQGLGWSQTQSCIPEELQGTSLSWRSDMFTSQEEPWYAEFLLAYH